MHTNSIAADLCNELVEEKKALEFEVALLKDKVIELENVLNVVLAEQADLMKDLEKEEKTNRMLANEISTQAQALTEETAKSERLIERLISLGLGLEAANEPQEKTPLAPPKFLLKGSPGETLDNYDSLSSPNAGLANGEAK